MRLCLFAHCYPTNVNPIGGNFIPDFIKNLLKRGNKVIFLAPMMKYQTPIKFNFPTLFFKWAGGEKAFRGYKLWNPIDIFKLWSYFKESSICLTQVAKKEKIEMFLILWTVPNGIPAYMIKRKLGVDYSIWSLGSDINAYLYNPLVRYLLKKILKEAKYLFANSIDLCKKIENLGHRKCYVLPTIHRLPSNIQKAVKKAKNIPLFLFVGRLERVKGIDILIDVIIELLSEQHSLKLYILGDGSLRNSLEKRVKKNHLENSIIFKGFVIPDVVANYLAEADCLIMPSRSEGMPVTLWEAVQVGVPVIGTNVGDLGYYIQKLNIGEVIPPNDRVSLKKAILSYIEKRGKKLPLRYTPKSIPDLETSTKKFLSIIQSQITGNREYESI